LTLNHKENIDANEESFEKRFAERSWMVTSVWFNSGYMKVDYVMYAGNHITNTFKLSEYEDWKKSISGSVG
jgi:hypothetical protein